MALTLKSIVVWTIGVLWAGVVCFGLIALATYINVKGASGFIESAPITLLPLLFTLISAILAYPRRVPFESRLRVYVRTGMALLVVLGSFAFWVWPTPWCYDGWRYNGVRGDYRHNRFTGKIQSRFDTTSEWRDFHERQCTYIQ